MKKIYTIIAALAIATCLFLISLVSFYPGLL